MLNHKTTALLAMAILLGPAAYAAKPDKIDVCHVPESTPDNLHIINISSNGNALNVHLSHGDWKATAEMCDAIPDNDCDGEPDPVADDADCVAVNGGPGWTCQNGICNSPPTDIALDSAEIDENLASGSPVGMLSSTDPDSPGPFTYTFVSGVGDSDNASFSISGSQLLSTVTFDFESKSSYSIRLMTDAGDGGTYQEAIAISVNDINEAPTAIALDNKSIDENQNAGATVGDLSTTDVDAGDSHVYTLVAGPGDIDNVSFAVDGDQIVSAETFDFEAQDSYSVRVQSEDSGGLTVTQSYSITINDINDPPTAIALDNSDVDEEQAAGKVVGAFTSTDVDSSSFEYSLVAGVGDADNASFSIVGDQLLSAVIFDYDVQSSFNIRVQTDDGDGGTFQDTFTITIIGSCGDDCFPNGVAAGDVETINGQSSVVLWARALYTGTVRFEFGRDPDFLEPYDGFRDVPVVDKDIPVKVMDISGLLPGTQYYYRACRGNCSPTFTPGLEARGRFFTPHGDGKNGLRFGVSSCFDGNLRPFNSISNISERNLDFFVALGDSTYADNPDDFTGARATNLKKFLEKNELAYSQLNVPEDNMFALARASTAVYVTIDDHEVLNNFAGGTLAKNQLDTPECNAEILGKGGLGKCFCDDDFDDDGVVDDPLQDPNCYKLINETDLYTNALRAWHDYNPIREDEYGATGDDRTAGKKKLYRYRTFGKDAAMFMLDTRSFRDENLSFLSQDAFTLPQQAYLPGRTLLGKKQLNDLIRDLRKADRDGITWKLIMVPEPIQHLGIVGAADRFEGFVYERAVILDLIETECIDNVVFISGDIHGSVVNNLAYQNPTDVLLGLGSVGNVQRFSTAWDISTGPVAYSEPLGVTISMSEPEGDREFNDSIFKGVMDAQLRVLSRPRTGLGGDIFVVPPLQQQNKTIPATLSDGFSDESYVSGHSYGWTEFEIDPASQKLTVTSWGIPWYRKGGNPALAERPDEINKFVVTPARPVADGGQCLFDKNCISCRCSLFTGIGDGLLQCESKLPNGSVCAINNQCTSDRCRTLICQAKEANGNTCLTDNDCLSDRCKNLTCEAKEPSGARCLFNNDCVSNVCTRANRFSLRRCQ